MFDVENLNEFVNRMFDNAIKSNSSAKMGLTNFRRYLLETSMCDDEYLKVLAKVILCSDELLALKKKIPNLDVVSFIEDSISKENKSTCTKQKAKGTKKNSSVITSNSCMGSSVTSSRCGLSSYTDRCGPSGYSSRC